MRIRCILCSFFIFLFGSFFAGTIYAEEISSFSSTIDVASDASFHIGEAIQYDFGALERHGIFRSIPLQKINTEGDKFRLTVDTITVEDEVKRLYPFTTTKTNETLTLKIGDQNTLVTGVKNYHLAYTVRGGITYFSDYDELYWNVVGIDWTVPIHNVNATVTLPPGVQKSDIKASCFVGFAGEKEKSCDVAVEDGSVTFTANTEFSPSEGMTVVVGFPKGVVVLVEPTKVIPWSSTLAGKILSVLFFLASLIWYLGLPVWIVFHWFRVGRDPKPAMGETHAWFDVPKTATLRRLTPGETGTLVDEQADMKDITGTIIDFARRGYLKIVETKKNDFSLEKRNTYKKDDTFQPFEKILFEGIFKDDDVVRLKDADLVDVVGKTKDALYESVVKEKFFDKDPKKTRTKYMILGSVGLFTFNIPLALSSFLFGRVMPKKTLAGSQSAAVGRSLRNFIVSQDRQFAYQAKKQLFFEKFLPYAVVFGVEKIWAERFADIKLTKPDWYDGYGNNAFTSAYLVSSLNSSMHSVTSAATPTHSSSGFSSGFSGGSVGGGGGGGGGGSW